MNKLTVIRIDHGHAIVNYYQPTTVERVASYIAKRGCESITFRVGLEECQTMTWEAFKKYFDL